jgi:hypothetical protein
MKEISLSFLGKDSVPDNRTVEISDEVYIILQKLIAGKKPTDRIFSHANSDTVNMFLKAIMPDITVKNLRTVKANQEFINEAKRLLSLSTPKTEIEKIRVFYLANKKVSVKLNHQKNVAKNYKDQSSKLKEKIKLSEENTKKTLLKIKEIKQKINLQEAEYRIALRGTPEILQLKLAEIKLKREKLALREERTKKSLERAHFNLEKKVGTKDTALGTALGAYLDARICISLCKEMDLDPGKVYTKKQLETFDYALTVDSKFWRSL